ncbi:D-sedoheptulose 7-phosphate isomerase [soil metagenome]
MNLIKSNFIEAEKTLKDFVSNEDNFIRIKKAGDILVKSFKNGGKAISCGNGGSMCDAMHFAEELTGRFRDDREPIAAISISDASHITCVANDYGFDQIFSRYVTALGNENDVLLGISTSGNSKNVLHAIEAAKKKGMKIVGLTGKDGGKMAELCDVEIRSPKTPYSDRVQEIHIKVIHTLINYIEENLKAK